MTFWTPKRINYAILIIISFLVYFFTLSKGLNVYDEPHYAKYGSLFIKDLNFEHLEHVQYLRNPLYLLGTLPLFYLAEATILSIEFLLNLFSLVAGVISVVFVYKTANLFLNQRHSLLAGILFIFIPWIWFNSIVADSHSLIICMTSIWIYFLISGVKEKSEKKLLYSTFFLAMSILAGIISAPLILVQAYYLLSYKRKLKWVLKHLVIGSFCLPVLSHFAFRVFFLQKEYEMFLSAQSFIFTFFLSLWNSVHAFSFPLLIVFLMSIFYIKKLRKRSRLLNSLFTLLILIVAVYLPFLVMPMYIPILVFQPVFLTAPIFVVIFLSKLKTEQKSFVFIFLIIFMILKFLPVAMNFSLFPHPHELYANFANDVVENNSVVFVGHEIPFYKMYANPTLVLYGEGDVVDISEISRPLYVTSQYIENENEVEFKELMKLPIYGFFSEGYSSYSTIVLGSKTLNVTDLQVKAEYSGYKRDMEDTYEWLYSIRGNILLKIFTSYDFPQLEYKIYELKA